ncbi:hypothetical protein ACFL6C_00675 [Myxococcota bacterium]
MRCSVCLLALIVVPACGPAHGLGGSIGESLSLEFNEVRIRKQEGFLITEYLMVSSQGTEKICKIILDTVGLDTDDSLVVKGEAFLQRVDLQRATLGNDNFPPKRSGELRLDDLDFRRGGRAEGDVLATFEDNQSLNAWFGGDIED